MELAKAEERRSICDLFWKAVKFLFTKPSTKIPFSAGILYTNDIDYHLAKHLAVNVIEEEPFEPVSDRAFEWAKQMIRQCKKVINGNCD